MVKILPSLMETVQMKLKQQTLRVLKLLEGNNTRYFYYYYYYYCLNLFIWLSIDSLYETTENLRTILPQVSEEIVNELLRQCVPHLKQVSDIPRLFRRTKRDVPTKPCAYVKNALTFLVIFHSDYKNIIPNNVNCWLELAFSSLTEQ